MNGCQKPTMDPPYLTLVGESEYTIDANGGPGSVEYRVTNPVQGASVSLSTDPAEVDWVTGLAAASGAVTFNVEVNTAMEERSAKVILSYPQAAETVEFTIKQAAAGKPVIKLASTTLSVTSAGGPTTVTYDVTNALEGLTQLLSTIRLVQKLWNPTLSIEGVLLTMFDVRTRLSVEIQQEVRKYFKEKVYHIVIPRNVRLSEAPSMEESIFEYDTRCDGAKAYAQLVKEVIVQNTKDVRR